MNKRESEIVLVEQDFSDVFQVDEDIESCAVVAYQYDSADYQSVDFDLTEAGYVVLRLLAGNNEISAASYSAAGYKTARLSLLPTTYEAATFITADSLSGGNAVEKTAQSATVKVEGGVAGESYRVVFTATTNYGNKIIEEVIVDIITD